MRLWLKDSERRPDPLPVQTDDRIAILVGLGCWTLALVVLLVFVGPIVGSGGSWVLVTCGIGILLGLLGLLYTHRIGRRS